MDELRVIYLDGVGGEPMNADPPGRQGFLLADEVVFRARAGGKAWVKMVEVHYNPAEHAAVNHPRFRLSQRYWGWLKIHIDSLFRLWRFLEARTFAFIAPPMAANQENSIVYSGGLEVPDYY